MIFFYENVTIFLTLNNKFLYIYCTQNLSLVKLKDDSRTTQYNVYVDKHKSMSRQTTKLPQSVKVTLIINSIQTG